MPATKFTPENRAVILSHLRTGGSLAGACRDIGVRLKTAEGWLTRGRREDDGDYAEFAASVEEARLAHERAGMNADEFDGHLAKAVRAGSVQAMKLWWEIHGKEEPPDDGDQASPFDALDQEDELAKARARKEAS
jgi:hypothetical protein